MHEARVMAEVVRFRIARAPQRKVGKPEAQLLISEPRELLAWLEGDVVQSAESFIADRGLAPPVRRYWHQDPNIAATLSQVRWLDELLLANDDTVAWVALEKTVGDRLDGDASTVISRKVWQGLREVLSQTLVASVVADVTVALRSDVLRLLLVMGLLELAATNAKLKADEVLAALRWRDVLLPAELLAAPITRRSVLARGPAFSDLYIVREEWARYELAEVAHIENVLLGEVKERLLERTDEQETTQTTEQDVTRLEERDTQTTDRFELKDEAERDMSLALHIDGKVETSGQYGPTHVDTHLGATFDYSVREAESRAVTQARETIARAVNRVEERVRQQRVTRSLTRIHSEDKHALDNKEGKDHVVGIYRWVDKIQTVQVFRYPHRMLFDLEVPEPGAFLRWRLARPKPTAGTPPIPFTVDGSVGGAPLTADSITASGEAGKIDFLVLAQRYAVEGLTGPPDQKMVFATITHPMPETNVQGDNKPPVYSTTSISVPDGFEATDFRIYAVATNAAPEGPNKPTGWLEIVVGTDFPSLQATDNDPQQIWRFQGTNVFREMKAMTFRTPVKGQVPIQLATDDVSGLIATVQVFCRPTEASARAWRFATFDLIQGAFWELRRQQEQAAAQAAVQAGIAIEGDSPARNSEVIREELKRCVVELLTGSRFDGRPAMTTPTGNDPTRMDLAKTAAVAAEIQFIEQAFEWENLSFVLYPYFWADVANWAELEGIESPDPAFDRFLRAGSARIVLPARPGFEGAADLYTLFGTLWNGGPIPVPNDPLYLSIADEVKSQQKAPDDGEPRESWEVRLPTTLVYLSPVGTTLPLKNASAQLPAK